MRSVLLQTTARLAYPIIVMFALFMFFRGHNFPGGGFIGGLLASAGILLVYIAFGMRQGELIFGFNYRLVAFMGLLCAMVAGLIPMLGGQAFLTSLFAPVSVPFIGDFEVSTVLLFDFGVFLVVLGTIVGAVKVLVLERRFVSRYSKELD